MAQQLAFNFSAQNAPCFFVSGFQTKPELEAIIGLLSGLCRNEEYLRCQLNGDVPAKRRDDLTAWLKEAANVKNQYLVRYGGALENYLQPYLEVGKSFQQQEWRHDDYEDSQRYVVACAVVAYSNLSEEAKKELKPSTAIASLAPISRWKRWYHRSRRFGTYVAVPFRRLIPRRLARVRR